MCARYHVGYLDRNCSSPVAALDPGLPILLGDLNYMKSMNHMCVSRRLEVDGWGGNPQRLTPWVCRLYDCVEACVEVSMVGVALRCESARAGMGG